MHSKLNSDIRRATRAGSHRPRYFAREAPKAVDGLLARARRKRDPGRSDDLGMGSPDWRWTPAYSAGTGMTAVIFHPASVRIAISLIRNMEVVAGCPAAPIVTRVGT